MSSAQRDLLPVDEAAGRNGSAAPFALKEQVAQRLAAHRARRTPACRTTPSNPIAPSAPANSRASRVAAAVAERYANSQSYRAFLAEQAESAIREAEAAAEVAALSAQAVADAQYQLLAELDQWTPDAADPLRPPRPLLSHSRSRRSANRSRSSSRNATTNLRPHRQALRRRPSGVEATQNTTPHLAQPHSKQGRGGTRRNRGPRSRRRDRLPPGARLRRSRRRAHRHSRQPDRVSASARRPAQGASPSRRRPASRRGRSGCRGRTASYLRGGSHPDLNRSRRRVRDSRVVFHPA